MAYFLDTNTCIYALKGIHPPIEKQLRALSPAHVRVASIVKAELLFGARKSQQSRHATEIVEAFLFPFEIVPFCDKGSLCYAQIRLDLEKRGTPIGPNDLILAATVLAHDGTLVTHNTKEFRRVGGLKVEDWAQGSRRPR